MPAIVAVGFFVFIQLLYYWERSRGISFSLMAILMAVYTAICIMWLYQLYRSAKERFRNYKRNRLFILLIIVILAVAYKPYGFIDFETIEGNDVLVATHRGSGCNLTLRLKADSTYTTRYVCFEISKTHGRYIVRNDTIIFEGDDSYDYAVLQKDKNGRYKKEMKLHWSKNLPHEINDVPLQITKIADYGK